jgi:hypothetical protein
MYDESAAGWDLVLSGGGLAVPLGLMLYRPPDADDLGVIQPARVEVANTAGDASRPLVKRDVPVAFTSLAGGMGYSLREGQSEDGAYGFGLGVYTRGGVGAMPAGEITQVPLPAGVVGAVGAAISDSIEFDGHLIFTTNTRYLAAIPASDPTTCVPFTNKDFGVTNLTRSVQVLNNKLYVGTADSTGGGGKLWQYTPVAGFPGTGSWSASSPLRRDLMTRVWWRREEDAAGGFFRLFAKTGEGTVGWTNKPETVCNPLSAADWTEGIYVGEPSTNVVSLATSSNVVWIGKPDGMWVMDNTGHTALVNSYMDRMIHSKNGLAVQYLNGAVYYGTFYGVDRVVVEGGLRQDKNGNCSPGFGHQFEGPISGRCSAFSVDQGYLMAAIYNPLLGISYVLAGTEAPAGSRNPLVWHGAEAYYGTGLGTNAAEVTHMHVTSFAGGLRRYDAMVSDPGGASPIPYCYWQSLPVAGMPVQDLLAAGAFRAGTAFRIYFTALDAGEPTAPKGIQSYDVISRRLGGAKTLVMKARANADPLTVLTEGTWVTQGTVATSPVGTIVPTTQTEGNYIETRIDGAGTATDPPIYMAHEARVSVMRRTATVKGYTVDLTRGAELRSGAAGYDRPTDVLALLRTVARSSRATLLDEHGVVKTVKVEADFAGVQIEDGKEDGWPLTLRLEMREIAA